MYLRGLDPHLGTRGMNIICMSEMIKLKLNIYSINRLSEKNVEDLLNLLKENSNNELSGVDAKKISEEYNKKLVFEQGIILTCISILKQFVFNKNFVKIFRGSPIMLFHPRADLCRSVAKPQKF